jgi:hypothetical protein
VGAGEKPQQHVELHRLAGRDRVYFACASRYTSRAGDLSWEEQMSQLSVKEEARQLVDNLPEDATWEDLQYEIFVRQAIEAGLKDSREGRTVPLEEVRRRFGLESS